MKEPKPTGGYSNKVLYTLRGVNQILQITGRKFNIELYRTQNPQGGYFDTNENSMNTHRGVRQNLSLSVLKSKTHKGVCPTGGFVTTGNLKR